MALQVLPHCWVHLVGVLGGVKLYLVPIIIIKISLTLSAAVRGRDWMDGSRWLWMT